MYWCKILHPSSVKSQLSCLSVHILVLDGGCPYFVHTIGRLNFHIPPSCIIHLCVRQETVGDCFLCDETLEPVHLLLFQQKGVCFHFFSIDLWNANQQLKLKQTSERARDCISEAVFALIYAIKKMLLGCQRSTGNPNGEFKLSPRSIRTVLNAFRIEQIRSGSLHR